MREFKRFYNETAPFDHELMQILDIAKTEGRSVELTWFEYPNWCKVIAHPDNTLNDLRKQARVYDY